MWLYLAMFCIALVQGGILTLCAMRMGHRLRILDYPDRDRKWHDRVTARTGGVGVVLALALGVVEWAWFCHLGNSHPGPSGRSTWLLLGSTLLLSGLGLYDDKFGMRPSAKLLFQTLAVFPYVYLGRTATHAHLFGIQLDLAWLAIPICLAWLVSCVNFVNLVDGMDGLAGSVAFIISAAIASLAWWNGQPVTGLTATILCGALIGFLCFNWPPARVFLGDSGSLPLGFLVGALSLEVSAKKAAGLTLAIPLVLLCIPMFDTAMAILRRKLNGRAIGDGDREHIHHVLRDRGLSPAQTLLWISAMCAVTALAGLIGTILNSDVIAIGVCGVLLTLLIAGRVFGFNEARLLIQHLQALGTLLKWMPAMMRSKFLVVRLENAPPDREFNLWDKIVHFAERLDAVTIEFVCEDLATGAQLAALTWHSRTNQVVEFRETPNERSSETEKSAAPVWEFNYSVPRGGDVQTRISARGFSNEKTGVIWLNQLSELLVALCKSWPVVDAPVSVGDQTAA